MSRAVKRPYESVLRAEQARTTRRAIVDAAAHLFVERGYGATTIDAIAEAAGVSRKTVFTSVGGKVDVLKLARDWAIAGDDEPVPLMERPAVKQQQAEPDARRLLRLYAAMVCQVGGRSARLMHALESAAGADPDVRALSDENFAQRQFGMRHLAGELVRRDALRRELTVETAADLLCVFHDARVFHMLVHARGWSPKRFEDWLAETLIGQLIRPDYAPSG